MASPDVVISFADESEALELHRFLCLIAQPVLMAPIDANDSIEEVVRVIRDELAINARINGELVGAIGLTPAAWWYNKSVFFLTDRWFFTYPALHHLGIGARLEAEAALVAARDKVDLVINGHLKRRSNGVIFTRPKVHQIPMTMN